MMPRTYLPLSRALSLEWAILLGLTTSLLAQRFGASRAG